jgi:endonuclease YncB( thermonuclease family)
MSEAALDETLVLLRVEVLLRIAERLGFQTNADEIRELVDRRADDEVLDELVRAHRPKSWWRTVVRWAKAARKPWQMSNTYTFLLALTVALVTAKVALGEIVASRVVGVQDGDTVTVLAPGNDQYRIRLAGIDAPEHNQAFGGRSKQNLSKLLFGKAVNLDCGKEESYGRLVCKILLPGGEDVCLTQIKAGLAWHYKQFENEQTPADRKAYAAAEDAAREQKIGLWSDPHPTPPWDFRHGTPTKLCFDGADRRVQCSAGYQGSVRGNRRSHIYQWPGASITTRSATTTESTSRMLRRRKLRVTGRHGIASEEPTGMNSP